MLIKEILAKKTQRSVITMPPGASVKEAVDAMVGHNVGCVVVASEDQTPVGILSERDVLRLYREHGDQLASIRVADVMTRDLLIGAPERAVEEVMTLMTSRRFRHLPIVDGGRLVGLVSLGDLVKNRLEQTEMEAESLKQYIYTG